MLIAILTVIGAFVTWLTIYNLVFVGIPTVFGHWCARSIRRTIPNTFALLWKMAVWLLKAIFKMRHSRFLPQTTSNKEASRQAVYVGKTGRDFVVIPSKRHQPITIELYSSKLDCKK